jgi:hypothetical protein
METDLPTASEEVDKLLNLPEDNEEVDRIRDNIQDPSEKVMFNNWLGTTDPIVELEADILMYDSVTAIAWVPHNFVQPREDSTSDSKKPAKKKKKGAGTMMGHYTIRVKRKSGKEEDVEAQIDWVEANFKPEVLATVQSAAYQKLTKVKEDLPKDPDHKTLTEFLQEDRNRTGFFDIEGTGELFVEVEGEGVGVKLDDDVINKFKYTKQKTVLFGPIFKQDKKGKVMTNAKGAAIKLKRQEKILPAQWYGYSKQARKRVALNTQWVEDNFDKRFLSQIKNMSSKKAAFVSVPPGDDREHSEVAYRAMATGPGIKYRQKKDQRTCMVYAMASAVHYAASKQLASEIRNLAVKFEFKIGAFTGFIQSLEKKHKAFNSKKENASTLDLLAAKANILYLACRRRRKRGSLCCSLWWLDIRFQLSKGIKAIKGIVGSMLLV